MRLSLCIENAEDNVVTTRGIVPYLGDGCIGTVARRLDLIRGSPRPSITRFIGSAQNEHSLEPKAHPGAESSLQAPASSAESMIGGPTQPVWQESLQ